MTKGFPWLKLSEWVRPDVMDERGIVKYEKNIHNWNFIVSMFLIALS